MTIFDDIRRDREAGTRDYHWIGRTLMAKEFGETVELLNAEWSPLDEFEDEHKRRIARVPELERIALAAEELAPAFQCLLEYLEGLIEDGCPQCGGDCAGANPPLAYCTMKEMNNDLAKYNAALAKLREASK